MTQEPPDRIILIQSRILRNIVERTCSHINSNTRLKNQLRFNLPPIAALATLAVLVRT